MPERLCAVRRLLQSDAVRRSRRDPEGSRAVPERVDLGRRARPSHSIQAEPRTAVRGSDIRPHGGSSLPPNECRSLGSRQMRWLSSRYPTHTAIFYGDCSWRLSGMGSRVASGAVLANLFRGHTFA